MTRLAILAVIISVGWLPQQTAPTAAPVRDRLQTALDDTEESRPS